MKELIDNIKFNIFLGIIIPTICLTIFLTNYDTISMLFTHFYLIGIVLYLISIYFNTKGKNNIFSTRGLMIFFIISIIYCFVKESFVTGIFISAFAIYLYLTLFKEEDVNHNIFLIVSGLFVIYNIIYAFHFWKMGNYLNVEKEMMIIVYMYILEAISVLSIMPYFYKFIKKDIETSSKDI